MIEEHAENFFGMPVRDWKPGAPVPEGSAFAIKVGVDWDEAEAGNRLPERIEELASSPRAPEIVALVTGSFTSDTSDSTAEVVAALVAAAPRFPALRALFLCDITVEECEISWIEQCDLGPLLDAYPSLQVLRVRGGTNLGLGQGRHAALQVLVIETGGLDASVVKTVSRGGFPELNHLELWLGASGYGATSSVEDLKPILEGTVFPKLKTLALRDCEYADDLAEALAHAAIVGRIERLDLSLGTLSDRGAAALLRCPAVRRLQTLDLHHHYISDGTQAKLRQLGPSVNLEDANSCEDEDDRYVAVAE